MLKHLTYGIPFAMGMALLAYALMVHDPYEHHRFACALLLILVACIIAVLTFKDEQSYYHLNQEDEAYQAFLDAPKSYTMRRYANAKGRPVVNIKLSDKEE